MNPSPHRTLRAGALLLASATLLPGCALLPGLQWASLAGQAALTGSQYVTPARATNTVHLGAPMPREACIEHNPLVPVTDLLPALQAELNARGVRSRVLPAQSSVACDTWIRYAAVIEWDVPPLQDQFQPCMTQASLAMLGADGRLVAQSEYRLDSPLAFSKWASTRKKLAPVVQSLLTGFES